MNLDVRSKWVGEPDYKLVVLSCLREALVTVRRAVRAIVLFLLVSVLCLLAKLQYDITAVLRDNRAAANILSNMMESLLD